MNPTGELLRRREMLAWLNVPDRVLDRLAEQFPDIVFKINENGNGSRRYYRRRVVEEKILGKSYANSL